MEYVFNHIGEFLEQKRCFTLPEFIINALHKGRLQIKGTELDKKLYKVYEAYYKDFPGVTKVLKEIKNGMILEESGDDIIIQGDSDNGLYIWADFRRKKKSRIEPIVQIKKERQDDKISSILKKRYSEAPSVKNKSKYRSAKANKKQASEKTTKKKDTTKKSVSKRNEESYYNIKPEFKKELKETKSKRNEESYYTIKPESKKKVKEKKSKLQAGTAMKPYKFDNLTNFLVDMLSNNREFDILRKANKSSILKVANGNLYINYIGKQQLVKPGSYIILSNGFLTTTTNPN